jgi:hypothetical protein
VIVVKHLKLSCDGFNLHRVSVNDGQSDWGETYGSEEHARAFIRGVQCGAAMKGEFNIKIVHEEAVELPLNELAQEIVSWFEEDSAHDLWSPEVIPMLVQKLREARYGKTGA